MTDPQMPGGPRSADSPQLLLAIIFNITEIECTVSVLRLRVSVLRQRNEGTIFFRSTLRLVEIACIPVSQQELFAKDFLSCGRALGGDIRASSSVNGLIAQLVRAYGQ